MSFTFIKRREVLERRGRSLSHQLRDEAAGRYPAPIKIGRSCLFVDTEIQACMAAELMGASDEDMRKLVAELFKKRATMAAVISASVSDEPEAA